MTDLHSVTFELMLRRAADVLRQAGASEVYVFGPVVDRHSRDLAEVRFAVRGIPPSDFYRAMADVADTTNHTLALTDLDSDDPFVDFLKQHGKLEPVERLLGPDPGSAR